MVVIKEPNIRTGKEYQAMIPDCNPNAYVIKLDEAQIYNSKKSILIFRGHSRYFIQYCFITLYYYSNITHPLFKV